MVSQSFRRFKVTISVSSVSLEKMKNDSCHKSMDWFIKIAKEKCSFSYCNQETHPTSFRFKIAMKKTFKELRAFVAMSSTV